MRWPCVAAALWLCAVSSREVVSVASNTSSRCSNFQCFDAEYPECGNGTIATADQPLQVWISSRSESLDAEDFSQVLTARVCHHLNRSTTPPLCWSFSQSMNATSDCNSTLAEVGVFEMLEDGSLRPPLTRDSLVQLLQSCPSFFALAGYVVNVIEGAGSVESSRGLFDVPVVSWIMVGLGILSSLFVITKPVWWDRIIMKCRQHCGQK